MAAALVLALALIAAVTSAASFRTRTAQYDDHAVQNAFFSCGPVFGRCGGRDFMGQPCCQKGCVCIVKDEFYSQCEPPAGSNECDPDAVKTRAKIAQRRVEALNATANEAWDRQAKFAETVRAASAKAAFTHRAEVKAAKLEEEARERAKHKIQDEKRSWTALTDAAQERIDAEQAKLAKLREDAKQALVDLEQQENESVSTLTERAQEAEKVAAKAGKEAADANAAKDQATQRAEHKTWQVENSRKESLPWLLAYADLVASS
jgi:flagellar biosynthesis GTPase FlhF